jgi:hypothetical protein
MEIKIKAEIDYDFEKAEFFLAAFDVERTDGQAAGSVPRKTTSSPVSFEYARQ